MMGIASFVIGILTILGALVGLIPLLGWTNWLTLSLALVGLILAIIALFVERRKGFAIAGLVFCVLTFCIGIPRLLIGAGIL
jgi:hypothetical protein